MNKTNIQNNKNLFQHGRKYSTALNGLQALIFTQFTSQFLPITFRSAHQRVPLQYKPGFAGMKIQIFSTFSE